MYVPCMIYDVMSDIRYARALKFCTLFEGNNLLCNKFCVDAIFYYKVILQRITLPTDYKNHNMPKMQDRS